MAKVLKIAAIVLSVVAIAIPVVGQIIGPVAFAALAGSLGVTAATLTAIGTIAGIAASVAGLAAQMLTKPKIPKLQSSGQQLEWTANPAAGEPYAIGKTMVGASVVHQASWGTKNKFLGIIGVLSLGPIQSYDGLYADQTQVTFSGGNATGYYANFLYLQTQLGAQPESTALDMTNGGATTGMPAWGAAYKTSGLATAGMVLVADVNNGKVYSGGVPKITNLISGVKAYDARLDSTQPGGSGAQRANNESTYVYSQNPWVHAETYALGRFQNSKLVIGPGLKPAQIDFAHFMEAATIADTNGWKISGLCYSTDNKWDVLKAMAQAGGGYPMPTGAHLACLVNAPKVSIATITELDVKGAVSAPQMYTRRQRINGAIPRIRCSDQGWEVAPLTAVRNATWVTADGGEHTREIEMPLVADIGDGAGKTQAAQLAAYEVANSRERAPISVELGYVWSQYKLGDCLTLNLPSANLVSQKCVIIARQINPASNTVTLVFRTEDDSKHAWALGVTGSTTTPPPAPPAPGAGDTGASVNGIGAPTQRLSFRYDNSTTPSSNEFPRDLGYKLYDASGNQITSGVTWSYAMTSGTMNTFTSASGSQSMSGTGTGTLTVSSLGSSEAKFRVTAVFNGNTYFRDETVTQDVAAAPISGGSGGSGSGSALVTKTGGFTGFSTTTWVNMTGSLNFTTPAGVTAVNVNVTLDATPGGSTSGAWTPQMRVMLGGVQQGSIQTGSSSFTRVSGEPDDIQPASFNFTIPITGLTASTAYTVTVEGELSSGTRSHSVTAPVPGGVSITV